jgi:hypothetical protein
MESAVATAASVSQPFSFHPLRVFVSKHRRIRACRPKRRQSHRRSAFRDHQMPLRVDSEEAEAFRSAAYDAGMTFNDWARFHLRHAAGLPAARPPRGR